MSRGRLGQELIRLRRQTVGCTVGFEQNSLACGARQSDILGGFNGTYTSACGAKLKVNWGLALN